jgi:hypothetical protein
MIPIKNITSINYVRQVSTMAKPPSGIVDPANARNVNRMTPAKLFEAGTDCRIVRYPQRHLTVVVLTQPRQSGTVSPGARGRSDLPQVASLRRPTERRYAGDDVPVPDASASAQDLHRATGSRNILMPSSQLAAAGLLA